MYVRSMIRGSIDTLQAVFDDIDDAAQALEVII